MGDYGRTSGTGGLGSAAMRNDDVETLDLPEKVDDDDFKPEKVSPDIY